MIKHVDVKFGMKNSEELFHVIFVVVHLFSAKRTSEIGSIFYGKKTNSKRSAVKNGIGLVLDI